MPQKNSGSGPKWVVRQDKLSDAINHEKHIKDRLLRLIQDDNLVEDLLMQEASEAIKTWYKMYHSTVLLVAARKPPDIYPVNTREEGFIDCPPSVTGRFCHEDSYILPAFGLEEEDSSSLSGLKFENMIGRFNGLLQSGALRRRFIQENNSAQSIVEHLLSKYQPLPLDNFPQVKQNIINGCQSSATTLTPASPERDTLIASALKIIEGLWDEEIESRLAEINTWLDNESVSPEGWWNETIGVDDNFKRRLSSLFPNGNRDIQNQVGKVAAISHFIGDILIFVENRFVYADDSDVNDLSHGFEGIVTRYSELDQDVWDRLLSITWASVAWQAINQARLAVREIKAILP